MLAAGAEHRLGNKLKQSRDRQQRGDGGGGGQARPSTYRDLLSHRGQPPPAAAVGGRAPADADSDDEGEEDRGRGASFQPSKRGAAAAGLSRSALLASVGSPEPGKHGKKKKKKKKKLDGAPSG